MRKTLWIQLGSDLLKKYMIFFRFYLTKAEFLALTPKDFDFEKNTLDITKSLQRVKKQDVVTPPKTSRSIRNIIIPDFVMNEVKDYMSKLYDLKDTDRVFPFTKSYINNAMERACKKSGVKKIRIHDIRHSHASYLINLGCAPLLISERLGHEKVQTTLTTCIPTSIRKWWI